MFVFWLISILSFLHFLHVQCVIPNLSVHRLDTKLIQRKRQDTLDMCRIFNEETARLEGMNSARKFDINTNKANAQGHVRNKRDTEPNPALKVEDMKRVESIVDRLYDDLDDNGRRVTYRHRRISDVTTKKAAINSTARRFYFAPAKLSGPSLDNVKNIPEEADKMSWHKKWKHGIVPYYIDPNTYDSLLSETIINAFDYFEKASCIRLQRLREKPTDKISLQNVEWLYISNPYGIKQCVHSNERKENSGVQMVVLGYDCLSLGEIVHEVMHILGYSHEHTRPDRDQFVTIMWDNIKPGYKKYFTTRSNDPLLSLSYDYASVLHYPARAFSKNGQATIVTNANIKIGQREGLSETDIEKIGIVYGHECVERNRQYLLKTCPSVVKVENASKTANKEEIDKYFIDRLWPFGIVNYKLKDRFEFSAEEKQNIKAVIRHIEKETCIEFRETTSDSNEESQTKNDDNKRNSDKNKAKSSKNVVTHNVRSTPAMSDNEIKDNDMPNVEGASTPKIIPNTVKNHTTSEISTSNKPSKPTSRRHAENIIMLSRSSKSGCQCPPPGRPNGNKILEINADCFNSVNELLHLFVHVLGLDHQHNMHDRDSFLHVVWNNLTKEIEKEMQQKLPPAASAGFAYDYLSVMHYPWLQIKNGVTSIMYPIWNDGWAMGHWQGLSSTDVQKLNLIYSTQCAKRRDFDNGGENR